MTALDRIRLTGQLRKGPASAGPFYFWRLRWRVSRAFRRQQGEPAVGGMERRALAHAREAGVLEDPRERPGEVVAGGRVAVEQADRGAERARRRPVRRAPVRHVQASARPEYADDLAGRRLLGGPLEVVEEQARQ